MSERTRAQATARHRRWTAARQALQAVTPWLAFRWVVAQGYNAHKPTGPGQANDKARAARMAASLVAALGGALDAPTPGDVANDKHWRAFTRAANALEPPHQQALLWVVWEAHWGSKPAREQDEARRQMLALDLTLTDMRTQQRHNRTGWVERAGYAKAPA